MKIHSLLIMGHATSISLEDEFWETLKEISLEESKSIQQLIEHIDLDRTSNLSSSIRIYILNHLKNKLQKYKEQNDS